MPYSILLKCFLSTCALFSAMLIVSVLSVKKAHNADQGIYAIGVGIITIAILIRLVLPCGIDYFGGNVIQTVGTYQNADISKSRSGRLGVHSVKLKTDNGEVLVLRTPIFSEDDSFPIGVYEVVAYYAPMSKILLRIDILAVVE